MIICFLLQMMKKAVLRKFPNMQISTKFFDAQMYVFSKNSLALAEEKRRSLTSIRLHLIPFLVRCQVKQEQKKRDMFFFFF